MYLHYNNLYLENAEWTLKTLSELNSRIGKLYNFRSGDKMEFCRTSAPFARCLEGLEWGSDWSASRRYVKAGQSSPFRTAPRASCGVRLSELLAAEAALLKFSLVIDSTPRRRRQHSSVGEQAEYYARDPPSHPIDTAAAERQGGSPVCFRRFFLPLKRENSSFFCEIAPFLPTIRPLAIILIDRVLLSITASAARIVSILCVGLVVFH